MLNGPSKWMLKSPKRWRWTARPRARALVKSAMNEGCGPGRQWVPCNKDSGDREFRRAGAFEAGGRLSVVGRKWGAQGSPSLPPGLGICEMWKRKQPWEKGKRCVKGQPGVRTPRGGRPHRLNASAPAQWKHVSAPRLSGFWFLSSKMASQSLESDDKDAMGHGSGPAPGLVRQELSGHARG